MSLLILKGSRRSSFSLFLLLGSFLFHGCSHPIKPAQEIALSYREGSLDEAEGIIDQELEKELKSQDFKSSKSALWLYLSQASIKSAQGDTRAAIQAYETSLDAMDYFNQELTLEKLSAYLTSDSIFPFQGTQLDQLLARFYFSLALLDQGDFSNASALLKQIESKRQDQLNGRDVEAYLEGTYTPNAALASYLLAACLEREGDLTNAKILYNEAQQKLKYAFIEEDKLTMKERQKKKEATLVFIAHSGVLPEKISATAPASVASLQATELLLLASGLSPDLALSTNVGIQLPGYATGPLPPEMLKVCFNNQTHFFFEGIQVAGEARRELDHNTPFIAARAFVRLLIRRALLLGAQKQSEELGLAADLGFLALNLLNRADTRYWPTLPYKIDFYRIHLPGGSYEFEVFGSFKRLLVPVSLRDRELKIINIYHPNQASLWKATPH